MKKCTVSLTLFSDQSVYFHSLEHATLLNDLIKSGAEKFSKCASQSFLSPLSWTEKFKNLWRLIDE